MTSNNMNLMNSPWIKKTVIIALLTLANAILITAKLHAQACPDPITVYNEPGKCGATVSLPRPCQTAPDRSGFYNVGITDVIWDCGATRCTTRVTVLDGEGPTFANCSARTVTLQSGQCGPNAYELLDPIDNCDAKSALTIAPANGNPYPINHEFKPGNYTLSYTVRDRSNNISTCTFSLTVLGVLNRVTSITCYRDLNISLDENCIAVITPKIVLEGGPYGCLDEYKVVVYDDKNNPLGDTVRARDAGKTLKVEVTSPDNNRCWANLKVEDKKPPVLDCRPAYTSCGSDMTPGAPLPTTIIYKSILNGTNRLIPSNATSNKLFPINVFGLRMGTINDINVSLKIRHTNPSNLRANLIAPNGTIVALFNTLGTCTNDDISITLDDEATLLNTDLRDSCLVGPYAKYGIFKPAQPLAPLEALNPNGVWNIQIIDITATEGGIVEVANIAFGQTGNTINFPTTRAISYALVEPNTYKVNGLDNCTATTLVYKDSIATLPCDSIYESIVYRTWNAEDAFGNKATPCTQLIYKVKNDLTSIRFPKNYDNRDTAALSCLVWGNAVPSPDVTGRPQGEFCKNLQLFPHEDFRFPGCDKSYKIIRRWKVSDWCTGEVLTHEQVIKVLDEAGPEMRCPSDITISASYQSCVATYKPAKPLILKECSNTIRYELSYFNTIDDEPLTADSEFTRIGVLGDSVLTNLPIGATYVKWSLTDVCFNESSCIFKITVRDQIAPVAVCRQFTTVSIGASGGAEMLATSFDEKSYDNCGIVKYEALKMTDKCPDSISIFKEKIKFCCEEVGTSVMVAFRVTDASGNSNTCMVEVKVEDKLPPFIICPGNKTIDCSEDYRDTTKLGVPVFGDNCGVDGRPTFKDSVNIDQCGRGLVLRTWSVKDRRGFTASCVQRITIVNTKPFTRDSIVWPLDYEAFTCGANFHPDSLPLVNSRPRIKYVNCSQVAVNYKDQVFRFAPGACEKTLRTWTVIDWCNYNEYTKQGVYEKVQILKLSNNIAPVFPICKPETVDVFDNCRGRVTQSKFATDDCKPEFLRYVWSIDVFDDGIAPDTLKGEGTSFDLILPVGKHKVKWTADDLCGNSTTCTYILTVRDGKKPTPYCLSSITTVVMPSTGSIAIWARDFDYGSSDNCTPRNKLKISFSKDTSDVARTLTCLDMPNGRIQTIPLQMWVTDEAGNQEFCDVSIVIQDNTGNVCPDNNNPLTSISGTVRYTDNSPVIGANLQLLDGNAVTQATTTSSGSYAINNYRANQVLNLSVKKSDVFALGINTLDLVRIQKHILAIEYFKKPEQLVAADFDSDMRITISDLVMLRKIILGIDNTMPKNVNPIKYVLTNTLTGDNMSTLKYQESLTLPATGGNFTNQDFTGIRLGDIDDSALKGLQARGKGIDLSTKMMDKNTLCFNTQSEQSTYGFQISFELTNGATIESISSPQLDLGNEYVYVNSEGRITIAWHSASKVMIAPDQPFIAVKLSTGSTNIPEVRLVGGLYNQWYDGDFNTMNINLIKDFVKGQDISLYQNRPNPFSEVTTIGVDMHEMLGSGTIRVFDMVGKLILQREVQLSQGMNNIELTRNDLGNKAGIYLYQMQYGDQKKHAKLILTE